MLLYKDKFGDFGSIGGTKSECHTNLKPLYNDIGDEYL